MITRIRALFRRVRSYILRKWFKVPVAAEKIEAGQPVYFDKDFKVTAAHADQPPRGGFGLAMHPADKDEQVQVVLSGVITFKPEDIPDSSVYLQFPADEAPTTVRGELLGYAAADIERGKRLEIEHEDEDGRLWLRPIEMPAAHDKNASVEAILLEAVKAARRTYGVATEAAAAGEPVIGVKG